MSTDNKYLVLRGKNKDIYFFQKRVTKKISTIIGKDFIKKSLETNDVNTARARRDKILEELKAIEISHEDKNVPINDIITNLEVDVPINDQSDNLKEPTELNFVEQVSKELDNVPINNNQYQDHVDESDGYFSFIDYSRLPKKEDISRVFDKIFPLAIVFLVIFITLLV